MQESPEAHDAPSRAAAVATAGPPLIPVSWGELLDKLTILQIKRERITATDARADVAREEALLNELAQATLKARSEVRALTDELLAINQALWDIEDRIRHKEAAQVFDADFIALARSVYTTNDRRAAIKRQINLALGSNLIEHKQHPPY